MKTDNVQFANLTEEQVAMLRHFEKDFNNKYGKDFLFLAMNSNK